MSSTAAISRENGAKSHGRPKPQKNRLALNKVGQLLHEHKTPADVMMDNMLFWHDKVQVAMGRFEEELAKPTEETDAKVFFTLYETVLNSRLRSQSCAVDLAPYLHPRLQAIAIASQAGNKIVIEGGLPQIEAPKDDALKEIEQAVGAAVLESAG